MGRISLKNIIGKKNASSEVIQSLFEQLKADISIEDENGNILSGDKRIAPVHQYPVSADNELIGWVKGDENALIISKLLTLLSHKEGERKKLGSEVLNLYQQVNLIFNFSEKLAQTIDPAAIAQITLDEASHIIESNAGVIFLWDENNKKLQVVAQSGKLFFKEESINKNLSLLLKIILGGQSEIMDDISMLKEAGIILPEVQSVVYAALKVKHRIMGVIILTSNSAVQYTAADLKFLTVLALQSSSAIESALLYEKNIKESKDREEAMRRIHEITGKFVPYEFIQSLGHDLITDVKLGDQVEKIVTVLFSDIRGYTTLSEQMTPEENFSFICSFNELMGPIIRQNKGFINQYLGDAIMAIFPGNAGDALAAAVHMQLAIRDFNKQRELKNQPQVKIGVGMHTGPLIMGITGDHDRLDATTISDTVNTASRLEGLTKYYKVDIIISEETLQQISSPETFNLRHLGSVQLKGKYAPISIHECFSGNTEFELQKKIETLSYFRTGISNYLNSSFDDAVGAFREVLEITPTDLTAKFFLNNATGYLNNGVPLNWMGVEQMNIK
ncbi:MAG: adenylate/guanylate cyclase domain-containing protein [Ginsengibacter sp.]